MKNITRFIPLIVLLTLIGLAYAFGLQSYLTLDSIKAQKEEFLLLIEMHPFLSAIAFVGIYTLIVALSLPLATLMTLLGGFLFGLVLGGVMVVSGATLGACIIFTIAKTSLGITLREKAGELYRKVEGNMKENAIGYLLFMRLVPVFPFVLVNVLPALFNIPLRVFFLTTFFGIMPGTIVYVYLGQQLGEINSLSDLARPELFLTFALLGIFALIPNLYKKWRDKKSVKTSV